MSDKERLIRAAPLPPLHTCAEDQVNQKSSHVLKLGLVQVTKYVAVVLDHRPETEPSRDERPQNLLPT